MSAIEWVNQRYSATASLVRNGVEVIVVDDPAGSRFNDALDAFLSSIVQTDQSIWDSVVAPAKALRWRRMVLPQPHNYNPTLEITAQEVVRQATRLRRATSDPKYLDEVGLAATLLLESDSGVGGVLLRSVLEVGISACTVIAASQSSKNDLIGWLGSRGIAVLTVGDLGRKQMSAEIAYVIGPPRFFRSSFVTSPGADELTFLMPSWFRDRQVPASQLSAYAEGAVHIRARLSYEGQDGASSVEQEQHDSPLSAGSENEDFFPQASWGDFEPSVSNPAPNEVLARKLLLSGNLAVWLDDGERIRALDPSQPSGERVVYADVGLVKPGTYLLLRQGTTERGVLYAAALEQLGALGSQVNRTQRQWKRSLKERLSDLGYAEVVRQLKNRKVKAAERVDAWSEQSLVRPQSDEDFRLLLLWLDLPVELTELTFRNAGVLRRAIYHASAEIRDELEQAVSSADLTALERDGHFSLDVTQKGIRGIVAARVLAISAHQKAVPRNDARVPFEDRGGQWLE